MDGLIDEWMDSPASILFLLISPLISTLIPLLNFLYFNSSSIIRGIKARECTIATANSSNINVN